MATFDIERFPESEAAKRMLSYVTPGWYDYSYVGKWLYEVMGREIDNAEYYVEDLLNQLFPETATWGMKYHEQKYGLETLVSLSLEERRKRVLEKRDTKAPLSPWRMEQMVGSIIDCNVSIRDIMDGAPVLHPNIFQVRFYGDGGLDMTAAVHKLNALKQSHTTYELFCLIAVMELEEFVTPKIRFRMDLSWWDKVLDGKYKLDGSILLDTVLPPYFRPVIRWASLESVVQTFDVIRHILPQFDNGHRVPIKGIFRAVFSWYGDSLDGRFDLDGSHLLSAVRPPVFTPVVRAVVASGEAFVNRHFFILPQLENGYQAISRARERFVAKWNDYVTTLDGSYDLDGTIDLDNSEHPLWDTERLRFSTGHAEDFKVFMYVPANAVFLDGEKLLDGTYFLNGGREEL